MYQQSLPVLCGFGSIPWGRSLTIQQYLNNIVKLDQNSSFWEKILLYIGNNNTVCEEQFIFTEYSTLCLGVCRKLTLTQLWCNLSPAKKDGNWCKEIWWWTHLPDWKNLRQKNSQFLVLLVHWWHMWFLCQGQLMDSVSLH